MTNMVQKRGFLFLLFMKLRRISDFQHEFSFLSSSENFDTYYTRFLESDLGKIYVGIPWDDLVKEFGLQESRKGARMSFSPRGRIALMFLKHYCCQSDKRLIEQLNSNIDYQFFCDVHLGFERITNYKIVSQIRCELADKLSIDRLEKALSSYWLSYMSSKSQITMDATCYESEVRYPTDAKLLWEAVSWLHKEIKLSCIALGLKMPRSKFNKWASRYIGYSKDRSKRRKKRRSVTRGLLRLLKKFIAIEEALRKNYAQLSFTEGYFKRVATISKLYEQQYLWFYEGIKPTNRIVSIAKNYIRPIIRGKEVKPIEWGAKVNKLQIDGISFIEHLSFDNFNEGTRLKSTIYKAQQLTKTKVKVVGADAIYATNTNRKFITQNNIKTDFKRKGRLPVGYKDEKLLKKQITKERATRLEGSFGKEKQYYHLKKVKAKTKKNEMLWIFFGIHTANALEIGRRMFKYNIEIAA